MERGIGGQRAGLDGVTKCFMLECFLKETGSKITLGLFKTVWPIKEEERAKESTSLHFKEHY